MAASMLQRAHRNVSSQTVRKVFNEPEIPSTYVGLGRLARHPCVGRLCDCTVAATAACYSRAMHLYRTFPSNRQPVVDIKLRVGIQGQPSPAKAGAGSHYRRLLSEKQGHEQQRLYG